MISAGPATRVFVALEPVDMRKGFDGLHGLVAHQLQEDPRSGHLFVFTNTQRNRLKILHWDGTGLWVCAKRLEKGRFSLKTGMGTGSRRYSGGLCMKVGRQTGCA